MSTQMGPWLTTTKAAEYLGISEWTARTIIRRGELKAIKHGKTWRTTPRWCDDYMLGKDAA